MICCYSCWPSPREPSCTETQFPHWNPERITRNVQLLYTAATGTNTRDSVGDTRDKQPVGMVNRAAAVFGRGRRGGGGAPLFRVARPKTDERKKGRRRRRVGPTSDVPRVDRRAGRFAIGLCRPIFAFFSLFSLPCLCFRRCLLMALWCFREAGEGRQQGGGKHPGGAYLPALATTQT